MDQVWVGGNVSCSDTALETESCRLNEVAILVRGCAVSSGETTCRLRLISTLHAGRSRAEIRQMILLWDAVTVVSRMDVKYTDKQSNASSA